MAFHVTSIILPTAVRTIYPYPSGRMSMIEGPDGAVGAFETPLQGGLAGGGGGFGAHGSLYFL